MTSTSAWVSSDSLSRRDLEVWLIQRMAQYARIAEADIDIHRPLDHYGLDSLTAVELTGALEQKLGRSLSPTLAYEYPTISALAGHLIAEVPQSGKTER